MRHWTVYKKGWDETENHPTSGNRAANIIQTLKKGWLDDDSDVSESAAKALEKINIEAEATEDAEFDF